jgi:hypothetical protein
MRQKAEAGGLARAGSISLTVIGSPACTVALFYINQFP